MRVYVHVSRFPTHAATHTRSERSLRHPATSCTCRRLPLCSDYEARLPRLASLSLACSLSLWLKTIYLYKK